MSESSEPRWSRWARELQAIAQNGLLYAQNHFEIERYTRLREIAAEMWAQGSGVDAQAFVRLFSDQYGYATPKVDVRGVVFQDHRLLLIQESSDSGWTLPGGWADPNESPAEAVVREIFEESGYRTQAIKLLAVYDRSKHRHTDIFPFHVYKLFMHCVITGGQPACSHETTDVRLYSLAEIEDLPLSTSRATLAQLQRMFLHEQNPHWPTDFD